MEFEGHFEFVVSGGARGTLTLADTWNNITNIGLDRLGVGGIANWCRLGSGNRPASDGDTSLDAETKQSNTIHSWSTFYEPGPPPRSAGRIVYRFAKGVAAGSHSEVGVGWAQNGDTLWSRTLIKDAQGELLTITVLEDEVLDVYYTLYNYPSTDTHTKQFIYKGVNRLATTRFTNVGQHNYMVNLMLFGITKGTNASHTKMTVGGGDSVLGDVYTNPTYRPNSVNCYQKSLEVYVNGSREREINFRMLDTNNTSDNLVGVVNLSVLSGEGSGYGGDLSAKTLFEPPLEKDYTEEFTYTGIISWARRAEP
jgi:hypothetical protein